MTSVYFNAYETYQEQHIDSESLHSAEELSHLKFRDVDYLVTTVGSRMAYHHQRIYMALWKKTQYNFSRRILVSWPCF